MENAFGNNLDFWDKELQIKWSCVGGPSTVFG